MSYDIAGTIAAVVLAVAACIWLAASYRGFVESKDDERKTQTAKRARFARHRDAAADVSEAPRLKKSAQASFGRR